LAYSGDSKKKPFLSLEFKRALLERTRANKNTIQKNRA
jgi:hypothetical protein